MTFHSKLVPLSYSSLKSFSLSPAHFLAYKNKEKKETSAMLFGRLIHKLVLEEDLLLEDFAIFNGRRAGASWKEFQSDNSDKDIVKDVELDEAIRIKDSIYNHPKAEKLLKGLTETEKYFKNEINGINFHGYIDGFCKDYILDLKTTVSSEPHKFNRDSWKLKYHLQAAIYCAVTGVDNYYIIAVEKTFPYVVSVYKLDQELIEHGKEELAVLIDEFKEWNGKPIGYDYKAGLDYFTMYLPEWLR
tara:strand:+ start:13095 stop:13829 length:735 start_codon:yes stop_codon:yes gene_type:complete